MRSTDVPVNKNTKELNSFKLTMTNEPLISGGFKFVRDNVLGFYREDAMKLSDQIRDLVTFANANPNVTSFYSAESGEDFDSGRLIVEELRLAIVPDYYGNDPYLDFTLAYYPKRDKHAINFEPLSRDAFWQVYNDFAEAQRGKRYYAATIEIDEPAKSIETVGPLFDLRSRLVAIGLDGYNLAAGVGQSGELNLHIWSHDNHVALEIVAGPGQ